MEKVEKRPRYRVKGVEMEAFDTLQVRTVAFIDDLLATENVEEYFVRVGLEAAAALSAIWDKHKGNIELVSEEGQ